MVISLKESLVIKKAIEEVRSSFGGTTFKRCAFPILGSPVVSVTINQVTKISFKDLFDDICYHQNNWQIAQIHYKRRGFGFSTYYPTFCHNNKMRGDTGYSFEELCYKETLFLIRYTQGEKGRAASWFCPFEEIEKHPKYYNEFKEYVLEAMINSALQAHYDILK